MEPLSKVGFIGLGNMGQPMAARLQEAGFTLTVFDSDPQARQTFLDGHGAMQHPLSDNSVRAQMW